MRKRIAVIPGGEEKQRIEWRSSLVFGYFELGEGTERGLNEMWGVYIAEMETVMVEALKALEGLVSWMSHVCVKSVKPNDLSYVKVLSIHWTAHAAC